MKLTDAAIRAARPGESTRKLSDGGGLRLVVSPGGKRVWRLSYRFGGKQKEVGFGPYPAVTLAQARQKRDEMKAMLAEGIDPATHRKREAAKAAVLWREAALSYVAAQAARGRAPKTMTKLRGRVEITIDEWGDEPVAGLAAPDLLPLLRRFEDAGKGTTARELRALVSRIFRHAIAEGKADRDPAADLVGALAAPPPGEYAAITDRTQVGALMRAIRGYHGDLATRVALEALHLTALRPGELAGLRWDEVHVKQRLIVIPAARMKRKDRGDHLVPMSDQLVRLLESIRQWGKPSPFVFRSMRTAGRPISDGTLNAALRRLGYSGDQHVAHGARKTDIVIDEVTPDEVTGAGFDVKKAEATITSFRTFHGEADIRMPVPKLEFEQEQIPGQPILLAQVLLFHRAAPSVASHKKIGRFPGGETRGRGMSRPMRVAVPTRTIT